MMPLLEVILPLLGLESAGSWGPAELCILQAHFGALGSALASMMQFALASAVKSRAVLQEQLQAQLQAQLPGMLDMAGANVLQVMLTFVQSCPPDLVYEVCRHALSRLTMQLSCPLVPDAHL